MLQVIIGVMLFVACFDCWGIQSIEADLFDYSVSVQYKHGSCSECKYNFQDKSPLRSDKNPPSRGTMSISKPDVTTSWINGESGYRIQWAGLDGALVKMELYKNNEFIDEISGWADNNDSYYLSESISSEWGSGTDYQLLIIDNMGNQIWSEYFQIASDMQVLFPSYDSYWATEQDNVLITWTGSQGLNTRIELRKNDSILDEISNWDEHGGRYEIPYTVPASWGTGSGYRIFVEDDLGNSAQSTSFSIYPIYVSEPVPGTVWKIGDHSPSFSWVGAHNVVRIELQRLGNTVAEIVGWMDDDGFYTMSSSIPSSWAEVRNGEYSIAVIDDLGNIGVVEPITINQTDDTPDGAIPLSGRGSDRIESPEDVDYWVVETGYGNLYKVTPQDTTTVMIRIFFNDGNTPVSEWSAVSLSWQSTINGEYFIKVISKQGTTGDYQLEFGRAFGSTSE